MGRRLNILLLATIAIMATLRSSWAQTNYVVGDSLGWLVPQGGASAYNTWAANKTFRVGNILVFNFATGQHDVAKVTKESYDGCNSTSPLLLLTTGPANVAINETGAHYFICTFGSHCSSGQKLAINVSTTASSPAPQPSSSAPQPSSPAPQPATPPPAPAPQPPTSTPAPASAPQTGSPSPTSSAPTPTPAPSMPPPSSPPPSPSPSTATPPFSSATPPTPPVPSAPSPGGSGGVTPPAGSTPPPGGNSATSLGVAGLPITFLSLIVLAFFM